MSAPNLFHKLAAETLGTFWLVLGGVASAVFSLQSQSHLFSLCIGDIGVGLAFGLTVLTGVYAFGTISGGHFNPAVTLGAALARRVEWKVVPAYWIVQVIGGLLGALVVYFIAFGRPGFIATGHMAANGYGVHSPTGYSLGAVILAEIVLTAIFLFVILGSTDDRAPKGFAGLAIGLTLTVIHLVAIPISNTSVNPARSTLSPSSPTAPCSWWRSGSRRSAGRLLLHRHPSCSAGPRQITRRRSDTDLGDHSPRWVRKRGNDAFGGGI
jgi:aquaporin Z